MAYQIRIHPDALHAAASEFVSLADRMFDIINEIENLVAVLYKSWEGNAGNQAIDTLDNFRGVSKRFVMGFEESSLILKRVAHLFENAEQKGLVSIGTSMDKLDIKALCPVSVITAEQSEGIKVITDELRMVAGQCHLVAELYEESFARVLNLLQKLGTEWEGRAYNRFYEGMMDFSSALPGTAELMHHLAEKIAEAAEQYEAMDNSLNF